jgi:hypothetical protein
VPLETERCVTVVTRSQSAGKKLNNEVTVELPADKLNASSAVHLNNNLARLRAVPSGHSDETVGDAKQSVTYACDVRGHAAAFDVVAAPPLFENVAHSSRPLEGAPKGAHTCISVFVLHVWAP